jgi:hypothetical protein
MSKDDLLDDLEEFVDGDWKKIYEENKTEEYRKEIAEPVIPDFPTYDEFYKLLVNLVGRNDIPPEVEFLIHKVIRNQDRKRSEAFDNIWSLFCDPHRYRVECHSCNCGSKYTVIIKRTDTYHAFRAGGYGNPMETYIKREDIHCQKCGRMFLVTSDKVIGLFREEIGGVNDIKQQS